MILKALQWLCVALLVAIGAAWVAIILACVFIGPFFGLYEPLMAFVIVMGMIVVIVGAAKALQ